MLFWKDFWLIKQFYFQRGVRCVPKLKDNGTENGTKTMFENKLGWNLGFHCGGNWTETSSVNSVEQFNPRFKVYGKVYRM